MRKITLRLSDGQEKTFLEQELIAIVEEHLQSKKSQMKKETTEFAQVPTEGKWFMVNPLTIDQSLFKEKRKDLSQEATRQYILEAFKEVKKESKYAKPFKTMIPEKTWNSKTIGGLKKFSVNIGDSMADWVEQALEWAQRIANGEAWEDICNKKDTAKWYRVVIWKTGFARMVGGCDDDCFNDSASDVSEMDLKSNQKFDYVVPLVVCYDV